MPTWLNEYDREQKRRSWFGAEGSEPFWSADLPPGVRKPSQLLRPGEYFIYGDRGQGPSEPKGVMTNIPVEMGGTTTTQYQPQPSPRPPPGAPQPAQLAGAGRAMLERPMPTPVETPRVLDPNAIIQEAINPLGKALSVQDQMLRRQAWVSPGSLPPNVVAKVMGDVRTEKAERDQRQAETAAKEQRAQNLQYIEDIAYARGRGQMAGTQEAWETREGMKQTGRIDLATLGHRARTAYGAERDAARFELQKRSQEFLKDQAIDAHKRALDIATQKGQIIGSEPYWQAYTANIEGKIKVAQERGDIDAENILLRHRLQLDTVGYRAKLQQAISPIVTIRKADLPPPPAVPEPMPAPAPKRRPMSGGITLTPSAETMQREEGVTGPWDEADINRDQGVSPAETEFDQIKNLLRADDAGRLAKPLPDHKRFLLEKRVKELEEELLKE